jgi:hypothetical protein
MLINVVIINVKIQQQVKVKKQKKMNVQRKKKQQVALQQFLTRKKKKS